MPRVHKAKKPNDDFLLQKNNIAWPSLSRLERFLQPSVPIQARQSHQDEGAAEEPSSSINFSWKAQKKFHHRKSLPSLLIKLISAGQEAGRRGTADTRLAKLLGEMALISHRGREAGSNITFIEAEFFHLDFPTHCSLSSSVMLH